MYSWNRKLLWKFKWSSVRTESCWVSSHGSSKRQAQSPSDFFVDWRWERFLQVSSCSLSSFLHRLLDLRTSISKRPYDTFWGFYAFQKIASRTISKWILTSRRLQKTLENHQKCSPKRLKNSIEKRSDFLLIFSPKIPPKRTSKSTTNL